VLIFEVVLIESMTNMQVSFRCKRANEPYRPLHKDLIIDVNLSLKPSHHLAEFFNQPLIPISICIYD
jgi:hypothetical protein